VKREFDRGNYTDAAKAAEKSYQQRRRELNNNLNSAQSALQNVENRVTRRTKQLEKDARDAAKGLQNVQNRLQQYLP
jgi:hypothetical protein